MKIKLVFAAILLLVQLENISAQTSSTFEDLSLPADSFWNGSDLTGGFNSGNAYYGNYYDIQYSSWAGWSYSSKSDTITAGWLNEFSAITGKGVSSPTYAIAYHSSFSPMPYISLQQMAVGKVVSGLFVTNSTFAYLSMRDGDSYSKKFGGQTGNDPDFFRLKITGYMNGNLTDSVETFLADFRDSVNTNDYILNSWQWIDLTPLGPVDSLTFSLNSSDNSSWGMNTPAYFCIDNLITTDGVGFYFEASALKTKIFPNPAQNFVNITSAETIETIEIIDASGRQIRTLTKIGKTNTTLNIEDLNDGIYWFRIISDSKSQIIKIIKK